MKYLETLLRFLQYTTGISAVCWDGTNEMLEKLEQKHCFSPQAQPHLVAREHRNILESLKTSYIYEMEDLLGVHLVTFLFQNVIVLVGPFVTETWDDGIAKIRLIDTALSASYMLLYKRYFCSYNVVDSQVVSRNVSGAITALLPAEPPCIYQRLSGMRIEKDSSPYTRERLDFGDAVRRYDYENVFLSHVASGRVEAALEALERLEMVTAVPELAAFDLRTAVANQTILRSTVRKAAERGGVHPAEVDAISLAWAQKMYNARSSEELYSCAAPMVREFTSAVCAARTKNYSPMVGRTASWLRLHLSQEVDVKQLAASMCCAPGYLGRRFKAETGLTITQYLTEERCNAAADLLSKTDLPIQNISAYVGYLDNSYFARVFKSCKGETPTAYRNKYRK